MLIRFLLVCLRAHQIMFIGFLLQIQNKILKINGLLRSYCTACNDHDSFLLGETFYTAVSDSKELHESVFLESGQVVMALTVFYEQKNQCLFYFMISFNQGA